MMSSKILKNRESVRKILQRDNTIVNPWHLSKIAEASAANTSNSMAEWDGDPSKYEEWSQGILQISHMLNVKDFITGFLELPNIRGASGDDD